MPNQVADKVKESMERCCEACHDLVTIDFRLKTCFHNISSGGADL